MEPRSDDHVTSSCPIINIKIKVGMDQSTSDRQVHCDENGEEKFVKSQPIIGGEKSSDKLVDDVEERMRSDASETGRGAASATAPTGEDEVDEENHNNDDVSSTISNVSDLSSVSESSNDCYDSYMLAAINFVELQSFKGVNPRIVFNDLVGDVRALPESISDAGIWQMILSNLTEPPKRVRLPDVTTLDDVVRLLKDCSRIIVLTGAGVSVSCGIPDFRSKNGVYARLAVDFPDLPDPQAIFDISYFRQNPRPFFKFAKEIYPGQYKPSPCHRFIKMLEKHNKLLRNYTQNIDTLEKVAGVENVVECHGTFATATCTRCAHKVTSDDIKEQVFNQQIPYCTKCCSQTENKGKEGETEETGSGDHKGIMKPDIVFFGEDLPETFHDAFYSDKNNCDLLIVIGSSLKVRPVALIPSFLPRNVPQILINRETLPHMRFDVELLGDSDVVIDHLCLMLGGDWKEISATGTPLVNRTESIVSFTNLEDSLSNEKSVDEATNKNVEEEKLTSPSTLKCEHGVGGGGIIGKRRMSDVDSTTCDSLESGASGEASNSSISSTKTQEKCYYRLRKRRYIFPGAEDFDLPQYLPNLSERLTK